MSSSAGSPKLFFSATASRQQSFPLHHMKGWSSAPPIQYSSGGGGHRGKQATKARSRTPTPSSTNLGASSKAPPSQRVDLPPLRKDAPGRVATNRGSLPNWESVEHQRQALERLHTYVHASSSRPTHESHLNTMATALRVWFSLFPPSPAKIMALGATFKEGGYRSSGNFFTSYRTEA